MCDCAECGETLDENELNVRFEWPEMLLRRPEAERRHGVSMNAADPMRASLMDVGGAGGFVRALLDVSLSEDSLISFGVWVRLSREDLVRTAMSWNTSDYERLELAGELANVIKPWDVLGAPVEIEVRHPNMLPWVSASASIEVAQMLTATWDRRLIHSALPWAASR